MAAKKTDPTDEIRLKASGYAGVVEGTACTQSCFKKGRTAFLYIGMQGGRYKAMFKLKNSISEAVKLAEKEPDRYAVGSTAWVTARFTSDDPMPNRIWDRWLDESYELSAGTEKSANEKKPAKKTNVKKKPTKRGAAKKN